jgi:hypothetical protein
LSGCIGHGFLLGPWHTSLAMSKAWVGAPLRHTKAVAPENRILVMLINSLLKLKASIALKKNLHETQS